MELQEFLSDTQARVKSLINEQFDTPGETYPYPELIFCEIVMEHMAEIGMTYEPEICHFSSKIGNANLRLSGYSVSEEGDELDLFVSLYEGCDEITPVSDTDTKAAAEQCLKFLIKSVDGRILNSIDQSNEAHTLGTIIQGSYKNLDQIRIYVLTDRLAKSKSFKAREVSGKTVKLEVIDIERLYRHWAQGKPRDELVVNFDEVSGSPLPCVYVPGEIADYDYAMTVFPGESLRFLYEKFGARLLEANVRSFLSASGKVNQGIQKTLKNEPEKFMAYNNGIVVIADELSLGKTHLGATGISWLKGMQIVNGGQTTASLYFAKKKFPEIDLSKVRIPAKIIILNSKDDLEEESLISDISKYANFQNVVKISDLSANKAFHVAIEKLALTTYCPDGVGRWFYERAAGSYNVMFAREGNTPAKLRKLKESMPASRKFTKTDLAKYLNTWNQKPHLVSLGNQKNFLKFMEEISSAESEGQAEIPDIRYYKRLIAQGIIYKLAQKITRSMFKASQGNIAIYTVALIVNRLGNRLNLEKIWQQQDVSVQLRSQIEIWAGEVAEILTKTAGGRLISEWAKKPECWDAVKNANYSNYLKEISELYSNVQ